jgi:hypothetical protein
MGTEWHTLAAVDADKGLGSGVKVNGVNRAGRGTFSALYAEFPFDKHPSAFALKKGACRARQSAGSRITGQAGLCLKAG